MTGLDRFFAARTTVAAAAHYVYAHYSLQEDLLLLQRTWADESSRTGVEKAEVENHSSVLRIHRLASPEQRAQEKENATRQDSRQWHVC